MKPHAWIAVGALSGAVTVALGAFGAHALKDSVPAGDLDIWRTGVLYQGLHALALVQFGLFRQHRPGGGAVGWAWLAGSVIFAGSLYAMVLGGPRWLGAITPFGGVSLIAGWVLFAHAALRE